MIDQSPSNDTLVLTGGFEGYEPSELFAMWAVPDFLERWWPEKAEVQSGEGGSYRFSWPSRNWILEGRYRVWEPSQRLTFTWRWNFDSAGDPEKLVDVLFEPREDGGTQLTITHGPYLSSEADQTEREGHREGWMHFCMRLAGLRQGELVRSEE